MQLLTQALRRKIPPLYSQEHVADPVCVAKFFMPDGAFTWYVIEGATREREGCGWGDNCHHRPLSEYDPDRDDVLFFGYVVGLERWESAEYGDGGLYIGRWPRRSLALDSRWRRLPAGLGSGPSTWQR